MSQSQKGICAEPNLHAQYLLFNVVDDDFPAMREKLSRLLDLFEHFDDEHYEAMVSGVIAIGSSFWSEIYPHSSPQELVGFPDMQCDDRCAPVLPCDLFIQIRADRLDICHAVGIEVLDLLRVHVELVEQVSAFRYLDGRDLTGFLDGEDNPRGMKKLDIAIVGDNDPEHKGGSYIHIQRYRHDMNRWNALSLRRQEGVMGKTKEHNLPLVDSGRSSHNFRTKLTGPNGEYPSLLKQSMPYGDMLMQGLFFVSCANNSKSFKDMLHSRIFGDEMGHYDRFLDYSNAETGAAFFAPSIQFIKRHAKDYDDGKVPF
ncbi:Dyp-type peroxidase [Brumicola nitratireducens]|uniref:Putative melanin biosynthesis protein TyrA n=1 Tax=Glaciecola nitratireducens (strain JCM 12485 / KCTC 12276 / FR1064) TaxID=1085623 RepID=G4QJH1_GLANF|nr:Dyp-type peroxidase [Glaciecola nitratireducens]AEP28577.1 putative melanin biosynthesis protein TyrA [Glaciecola nitratireducens FR1064]